MIETWPEMAGRPLSPQEFRQTLDYHTPVLRGLSARVASHRGQFPHHHIQVRCKSAALAIGLANAKYPGSAVDGDPLWAARANMNAGFFDVPAPMLTVATADPVSWPRVSAHCYAVVYSVDEIHWMRPQELRMFMLGCFFLSVYNVHVIPQLDSDRTLKRLRDMDIPPTEMLRYKEHMRLEWEL